MSILGDAAGAAARVGLVTLRADFDTSWGDSRWVRQYLEWNVSAGADLADQPRPFPILEPAQGASSDTGTRANRM
jgi:hypothetical protein